MADELKKAIIATPRNYWIAPQALNITLNALGEPNRIQASVASGAAILCYVKGVKAEDPTDPDTAGNGDGLEYDIAHNYRRWPLRVAPTFFNSNTEKYLYVAIPRKASVGTEAMVVFPSEMLDIYGWSVKEVPAPSPEPEPEPEPEEFEEPEEEGNESQEDSNAANDGGDEGDTILVPDKQVGSEDYFYIWLQGIITSSGNDGTINRDWDERVDTGRLNSDEAIATLDGEWYRYSAADQVVTFLKEIFMDEDASFINLILNNKELIDVATSLLNEPVDSDKMVATPGYVDKFYLSKFKDDIAHGRITFEKGLEFMTTLISVDKNGNKAEKGFLDGRGIYMDADEGLIETDGLNVRGFLRVMELIINRLQLMESDYSFTEGDTVERVDYEVTPDGQGGYSFTGRMILTMHKDHDKDFTPFYPGDIIYGIVNLLLERSRVDGHESEWENKGYDVRNCTVYYHTWMVVRRVDHTKNQLTVDLYQGKRQDGTAVVPGGTNFSPYGTAISTDVTTPMTGEYNEVGGGWVHDDPDDPSTQVVAREGYESMLTVTRRGNVADGINPDTGQQDPHIKQSQLGRQQSWVLSTTDQRLTYYWRVDEPFYRADNIAMCLGIMPTILDSAGILPSTRDKSMPSLYINTIFYEFAHHIHYPSRIVKEDRGEWVQPDAAGVPPQPYATYTGDSGSWTPDGTLTWENIQDDIAEGRIPANRAKRETIDFLLSLAGTYDDEGHFIAPYTYTTGQDVFEPYHFESITAVQWLSQRLSSSNDRWTDRELYLKVIIEWHLDLETSRVWRNGKLWECLREGTTQPPALDCTDWSVISGNTVFIGEISPSNGRTFRNGNVDTILTMRVWWGDEDVTDIIMNSPTLQVEWSRSTGYDSVKEEFVQQSEDLSWTPDVVAVNKIHLRRGDMGSGWMISYCQARIDCVVTYSKGIGEQEEIAADYTF